MVVDSFAGCCSLCGADPKERNVGIYHDVRPFLEHDPILTGILRGRLAKAGKVDLSIHDHLMCGDCVRAFQTGVKCALEWAEAVGGSIK